MCDVYVETLRGSKMANLLGRFGDVIFDGNSKRSCTPAFLQSQPIGCRNCCLHERYYSLSREYCSAPQRIRATLRLDRSAEPMEKLGHDRARRSPSKIKIFRMHFPNIPRRRGNNFIGFVVTNQHFGANADEKFSSREPGISLSSRSHQPSTTTSLLGEQYPFFATT